MVIDPLKRRADFRELGSRKPSCKAAILNHNETIFGPNHECKIPPDLGSSEQGNKPNYKLRKWKKE